jgi:uncharacterized protein involved in outer membrane biogenesis
MRRTALLILAVAGGLVALVLIGVAIALATVDVQRLKGPLTARLAAATGRTVTITGPLALDLSLTPTLRADGVSLGNASWGSVPVMVQARQVEAQVALLPLLQRRFDIVRVTLVEPQITLETNRQGVGNWEFGNAAPAASPVAPPGPASMPEAAALAGPAIGVRELEIRNGVLRYRDGASGAVTPVQIDSFVVRASSPDAPIAGEFRGSVSGVPLSLRANLGSLALLRSQRWPYPLELDGDVAGRSTTVKAKLTPAGNTLRADAISAMFGGVAVDGSVTVDRSGQRPRYVVDLHLPRFAPDVLALAAGTGATTTSPGPAAAKPTPPASRAPIVPATTLPLDVLHAADAEGRVRVDQVPLAHGQTLDQLDVAFGLRDGRLALTRVAGALLGGTLTARATLDGNGAGAIDVHAEGRDLDLARVLALVGSPRPVTGGKTRLTLDAQARGASPHAWIASMDGNALLLVGAAQLRNVSGNTSKLDELGAAVNPFRNVHDATDLRCAVVRLPVRDGVAHVERSIAFETAELGVSASGTVDFRNETIDLALHPQLRQGISLDIAGLADAVRLRGPFSSPQVSIDPAKSATALARIGAAIGTGGWSLLGETLVNATSNADSPCAVALDATGAKAAAQAKADRKAGSNAGNKAAPALPGNLGKALGRLLGR